MKYNTTCLSFFLKIFIILVTLFGTTSFAQEEEKVQLSLISDSKSVGSASTLLLGLRAQLAPHWKTYWRSPGIAGYEVKLNWEGSRNIKSVQMLWPLPRHVSTQMGTVNAYEGDTVFPLLVEIIDPTQPVHALVQVDMLVCDESSCLPVMQTLALDLPIGPKVESAEAPFLHLALNKVPKLKPLDDKGKYSLQIERVEISGIHDSPPILQVIITKSSGTFSQADLPELFLEMKDLIVDSPSVSLSKDQKSALYSASVYPDTNRKPTPLPDLVGKTLKLTVGYDGHNIELEKNISLARLYFGFWVSMLFIAFIGGLILNIMPCVLPVLSLKILSVMRHGGGHNATVRQEFLATVLGILFSFILLATAVILLKISGQAVGWGVQFQEPYFLITLIAILTLFACNLFGFFEFRLPFFLSSLGGISTHRESLLGSFLEGCLVTVLATPCTAPFLGTALAFAFSQGTPEILTIFSFMGLGLAFPFLLIAFFPNVATMLPKPGIWMVKVKHFFGFLIIITAIWLVYVLIAEIGQTGSYSIAMLMLFLSLFLKKAKGRSEVQKNMAWLGASLLIAASFLLPVFISESVNVHSSHKEGLWKPFEPERIEGYVKAGKTVLVNVTADWCLTCQANKYFVLKNKAVLEALRQNNVILMEADWTNHDPKITAYLKSFNQYGIPFYAVYGCKTSNGEFLGQILTPQKVLQALENEKCFMQLPMK
ncbi:MAG: protein-disulfide reductase DsbD family protein [Candidatus Paracaedibacter sp.]